MGLNRYRLVKRRNEGYDPYYEVQKRIFGFIWVLCAWSVSLEKATEEYNRLLTANERPYEFEVLKEDVA